MKKTFWIILGICLLVPANLLCQDPNQLPHPKPRDTQQYPLLPPPSKKLSKLAGTPTETKPGEIPKLSPDSITAFYKAAKERSDAQITRDAAQRAMDIRTQALQQALAAMMDECGDSAKLEVSNDVPFCGPKPAIKEAPKTPEKKDGSVN